MRLAITPCNASLNEQLFVHNNVTGIIIAPFAAPVTGRTLCVAITDSGPMVQASYNNCGNRLHNTFTLYTSGNRTVEGDAGNQTKCLGVEQIDPAATYQNRYWTGTDQNQYWAKPVGGGSVAVLLINPNPIPHDFAVPPGKFILSDLQQYKQARCRRIGNIGARYLGKEGFVEAASRCNNAQGQCGAARLRLHKAQQRRVKTEWITKQVKVFDLRI
eukprot:COSAG01_NODE_4208_length_5240_cov_5.504182_4_plen_216_part_00